MPDWEIIRWDENNFDLSSVAWTKEAVSLVCKIRLWACTTHTFVDNVDDEDYAITWTRLNFLLEKIKKINVKDYVFNDFCSSIISIVSF